MRPPRLYTFLISIAFTACGDGTIKFGGGDQRTPDAIVVEGDVRDINPQVAGADTVVFVYTNLSDDAPPFTHYEKQRSVAVSSTADPQVFTVTQIASGNLTLVLLQDNVNNPDGTIDVGDPYAILSDPNNLLEDARGGETIRVSGVDVDFNRASAKALSIRSERKPDTTVR